MGKPGTQKAPEAVCPLCGAPIKSSPIGQQAHQWIAGKLQAKAGQGTGRPRG